MWTLHFYLAAIIVVINNGVLASVSNKALFLNDFVKYSNRPSFIVSMMDIGSLDQIKFTRELNKNNIGIKHTSNNIINEIKTHPTNNNIYIFDFNEKSAKLLKEFETSKIFPMPARWMGFVRADGINDKNSSMFLKPDINTLLNPVDIGINIEFYVIFHDENIFYLNLVYRVHKNWSLIWEELGTWDPIEGLIMKTFETSLTLRRKDLRGLSLVATSVVSENRSDIASLDYKNRGIDVSTKVVYHMVVHLFEWMNSTPKWNRTNTWGYLQADGISFNGLIQEIDEGRTDLAGTVFFPTHDRLKVVDFSLSPATHLDLFFVFSKPALASVNNLFYLPFDFGVWIATLLLIAVCSLTLCFAYIGERKKNNYYDMSFKDRLLEGFHETMCLVFQQGTPADPLTFSCREILLTGLLSFMFLYTAYSAKIVGLLQSSTDDIKTVEDLVSSPLSFGAYNKDYNKAIFLAKDKSLVETAFFEKKIVPKGDKFFLPLEEGIQKVQSGLYAFHVERTNGIDHIQKTFYEHEKCNLGYVHYMPDSASFCYFSIPKRSKFKEQLRVGATRLLETGVQSRTTRRITPELPKCSAGAAIFAAVTMMDVAPALKTLLALYGISVFILVIEIWVQRRYRRNLVKVLRQRIESPVLDISS